MRCKCIKESKWYCIDDSAGQSNHGGAFEYVVDEVYECELLPNEYWGDSYSVKNGPYEIGFATDSKKSKWIFFNYFELIDD
jgi:hypothetical protein